MTPDELETEIRKDFNKARGRLAGLIESWDLGERRERAMIQTMKSLSYDSEASIVKLIHDGQEAL